jgi:hypothetical protein
MKRQIAGLRAASDSENRVPDGIYLVRVQCIRFQRNAPKPYYTVALIVIEPRRVAGNVVSSRLYCSPKALWKLDCFLRDFGYDLESMERDEVD